MCRCSHDWASAEKVYCGISPCPLLVSCVLYAAMPSLHAIQARVMDAAACLPDDAKRPPLGRWQDSGACRTPPARAVTVWDTRGGHAERALT